MSTLSMAKPEILKSRLLLRDVESEMKKEFDRRKKLRLQQVRQQSKDLAYTLREKVRLEKSHQQNLYEKKKQKQLNRWQEEKLSHLQELYRNCLEDVGQSHIKAAEQPDAESAYLAEQKRNAAKAANRGKEARRLKILLDDENKHRGEALLIRKQLTRTKEDIRSIFVSSLSPPPIRSCSKLSSEMSEQTQNKISHTTEQQPRIKVLQEIPSNIQLETVGGEIKHIDKRTVEIDTELETNHKNNNTKTNPCTNCGYTCCCHRVSTDRSLRRRCYSESRLPSDSDGEYDSDSTWPPRASPHSHYQSDYSSKATSIVKCYDYTNNFRKKYKKPIHITRHGPGKPDVRSLQEVQSEIDLTARKSKRLKKMADKDVQRGKLAMYKEKINKDFENLRQELQTICREERTVASKTGPNVLRGIEHESNVGLRQRTMEGALLDGQNMVTVQQTSSTVNIQSDPPNVLNVSRKQHSRSPSPSQPLSFDTSLQDVLNRIAQRRTAILQKLNSEDPLEYSPPNINKLTHVEKEFTYTPKGGSPKKLKISSDISMTSSSEDKYSGFFTHTNEDKQDYIQYTDKKKNFDVLVKSPRNLKPNINVDVNKSSIGLNIKGIGETNIQKDSDGVTVTVRVNKDSTKPLSWTSKKSHNKTNRKLTYESGSTSYNSPPDILTPSKKIVIDSLVNDLQMKGTSHNYLTPYITKLLTMSRESVYEMSSVLNDLSTVSIESESSEDLAIKPTPLVQDSISKQDISSYKQIKAKWDDSANESENLKSVYDSLTENYIKKLFEISNTFEELLKTDGSQVDTVIPSPNYEIPASSILDVSNKIDNVTRQIFQNADTSIMDILDVMGVNQSVISAESSYFQLPPNMKNNTFPINEKVVASRYRKYPKADQTFQELADILVSQQIPLYNLPHSLLPKPPTSVSNHDYSFIPKPSSPAPNHEYILLGVTPPSYIDKNISRIQSPQPSLDTSIPEIPDIQAKFGFTKPKFLLSDPNEPSDMSGSIDVFQGINLSDFNIAPIRDSQHISPSSSSLPRGGGNLSDKQSVQIYTSEVHTISKEKPNNLSSPDEIESDFQKMGLGWAGTTLRKTREAAELSAGSSSGKNVSLPMTKPRKQPANAIKLRDRSVRSTHRSRYSSPINSKTQPLHIFSTSTETIGSGVGQYTKKKKKAITISSTDNSDLSPPNVSLRRPTLRSPNTDTLSRRNSPRR